MPLPKPAPTYEGFTFVKEIGGYVNNEILSFMRTSTYVIYARPITYLEGQPVPFWMIQIGDWIYNKETILAYRTSPLRNTLKAEKPPKDLLSAASDLEILVYYYLLTKGEVFEFQAQLIGGFGNETGDTKVDFTLPEKMILFRVQGDYFHTGADVEAKDYLQKDRLSAMGYTVIDLWGHDLQHSFNETMTLAMQGQEMPH